jgi:hypothetical protein
MKFWATLAGGLLAAELCLSAAFCLGMANHPSESEGKAFITQTNRAVSARDYDTSFGENWESVRTFRLLAPLEKPLKIYIEEHPRNEALYKPQYRKFVLESIRDWNEALDGRLSYTLTRNRQEADITVDWVSSFDDRYVAGITTYSVGHAGVEIKTVGVPEKDIKCNILHEFGHALGISGHSNHPGDIMVGMRRWHRDNTPYEPKLSKRDVQAIRRLYSLSWQKGEDLFSANAQRLPVFYSPVALSPQRVKQIEESTVVLQSPSQSGVIQWNNPQPAPQSEQPAIPPVSQKPVAKMKPRFTQIFH